MAETMEQYMSKTRADYGSGVSRPKIEDKDNFKLKGQFIKELRTNTFSGSDHEDANKHIEKVLEIIDLFRIPNSTVDQVMLRAFRMSLNGSEHLGAQEKLKLLTELAAPIQAQLSIFGREIKKVNEKSMTVKFGCDNVKTKANPITQRFPLKKKENPPKKTYLQ
ncbi:hypothetical protein Tco_1101860 [Tanacetum coccineum]